MRNFRLIFSLSLVLLLVVACGPKEPIIETAAGDMNLTAADLESNWSLDEEQGMETLLESAPSYTKDANMRTFTSDEPIGVLVSIILTTNSVAAAKEEMIGKDLMDTMGIKATFLKMLPNVMPQKVEPPDVGDEAVMIVSQDTDLGFNVYALVFRKSNVIAMLFFGGTEDWATDEAITGYAQILEAKIR